ncbi:hypothetical protein [Yoonia maritima]|uniref:hypothetical protein n=1 Tax=Yoonia maritima TaxID=1435347 RepID=UPI000D103A9C|nr:hypothetical protein [Yoonia maritima]
MRILALSLALAFPASTAFAIDDCLVGTWVADLDDLAHIMAVQMNATGQPVGGEVTMQIAADGTFTTLIDNLIIRVEAAGIPPMDVSVVGYNSGVMTTDDGAWVVTVPEYDLVGSADVMGQRMDIPFSSETGLFGGGLGIYGCRADSVAFESTGDTPRIPRSWTRVD